LPLRDRAAANLAAQHRLLAPESTEETNSHIPGEKILMTGQGLPAENRGVGHGFLAEDGSISRRASLARLIKGALLGVGLNWLATERTTGGKELANSSEKSRGANQPTTLAADWPRFRGPNGAGEIDGLKLPVPWTPQSFSWQLRLPGNGHSSPVVYGERMFITSADPESATQILWALRASDGKLLWERRYPSKVHRLHQFNSFASSTPALDEKRIFWAWATPEQLTLVALDQLSGEELWRVSLGPFISEHGFGASPVVVGKLVILANEQDGQSFIVAVDATSGRIQWQTPRRSIKTAYSTPCLLHPPGGTAQLVLASWAHGVYALELETGKPLWECPVFRHRVVSSPCIVEDVIVASCGEGGVGRQLVLIRPPVEVGQQPQVLLELERDVPYVPTAVRRGPLAFLWSDRGVVSCLDVTSQTLVWKERVGGQYFASPLRVGDHLVNISRQGEVVILEAGPKFHMVTQFSLQEGTHATPAVAGQTMYVRTFSHVFALPCNPV
jgi:outer membrane protein assembly factor BamB